LIDKGPNSKSVIDFLIKNNIKSVMGNHEYQIIKSSKHIIHLLKYNNQYSLEEFSLGVLNTIESYGLIKINEDKVISIHYTKEKANKFIEHIQWLKKLPIYITLKRPDYIYLISHSCILNVIKKIKKYGLYKFKKYVMENRAQPKINIQNKKYFNIYGHTPNRIVNIGTNHANVDTGACYKKYGVLSAYCIETKEVITH